MAINMSRFNRGFEAATKRARLQEILDQAAKRKEEEEKRKAAYSPAKAAAAQKLTNPDEMTFQQRSMLDQLQNNQWFKQRPELQAYTQNMLDQYASDYLKSRSGAGMLGWYEEQEEPTSKTGTQVDHMMANKDSRMAEYQQSGTYDIPESFTSGNAQFVSEDYLGKAIAALNELDAKDKAAAAEAQQAMNDYVGYHGDVEQANELQRRKLAWINEVTAGDTRNPADKHLYELDRILNGTDAPDADYAGQRDRLLEQYNDFMANTDLEVWLGKDAPDVVKAPERYESNSDSIQAWMDYLQGEKDRRDVYNSFYNSEENQALRASDEYADNSTFVQSANAKADGLSTDIDTLHAYLNSASFRNTYESERHMWQMASAIPGTEYHPTTNSAWEMNGYAFLSDDELADFNAAYAQSEEAAQRYLSSLAATGVLNRRRAEAQTYFAEELAADPIGRYIAYPAAAFSNFASGLEAPAQMLGAMLGNDDSNSWVYDTNRFTSAVRTKQGEMAGEALDTPVLGTTLGELLYNGSNALVDNALAVLVSGGYGAGAADAKKLVSATNQAIMGSQVASNTLYNELESGTSAEGAVAKAMASAMLEAATEKYSIEALLSDPASVLAYIGKNFLAEASEESASALLNPVIDSIVSAVTNDKTELERTREEYLLQGYSDQEATQATLANFAQGLAADALIGGMVGGISSAPVAASAHTQGKQLKKTGTGEQLMQIAEQMPEDSKSKKLANKITKTKSNFATAQLYNTLAEELPGAQDVLDNITTAGLANHLRDEGEEGDTQAVAKSIVKLLRGNQLTAEEYSALAQSKHGMSVLDATVKINQRDSGEMQAYDTAYKAGFYGQQAAEGMNTEYYQAGVEAAQKAEQARLNKVGKVGLKGGGVTYVGAASTRADVYGGKVQALNTETLAPQQRVAVQALEGLSKVSGMNFVLYEGQADANGNITIENGSFDSKTNTIYLDLNAGKNRADQGVVNYAILRTAAHEMTHFIESNSKDGYAALKKFVVNELTARGQNFDALVEGKMRTAANQGVELTRGGAVAEVIADACEMALKDTQAIRRLAKQDKSLYGRIKSFLRDLMGKIRKALEGVGAAHAESRALMDAEKYIDGLQKLWDDALVEAVETAREEKTDTPSSYEDDVPVQMSNRSYDFSKFFSQQVDDWINGKFPNPDIRYSVRDNSAQTSARVYEEYRVKSAQLQNLLNRNDQMKKSEEFASVMDLIRTDPNAGVEQYKKLLDKYELSGQSISELQKETNALYSEYKKLVDLESKQEEERAIVKSGKSAAEYHRSQAVKVFGYTPYFVDAGYLLPNGKMLNFSGEKGKHYGMRGEDHRAIGQVFANVSGSEAMVHFMHEGNIRLMPESPGMDIATTTEPTNQQYTAIRKFVREYANQEQLSIDFTDENGREVGTLVYDGRILADRVVNDIRHYFETGEIREQGVSAFHYSLRETTPEDLAREYLESMQPTNRMTDSEKWLLNKYQTTLAELREKEAAAAEQEAIAQSAQTHDDRVKAQNRAKILRTQANRLRNTLRSAERADGFASLLRMSEKVARRFADSMDKATGTHDDLDAELQKVQNQLASVARNLKNAEAGQKAAFARGLFEQKALNDAGNNIRKAFNTRMSGKAIADRLALAYAELYAAEDEGAQMRFASALHNLAVEILESSRNRYRSATLEMLRETLGGSIGLSEAQKQELKKAGISMAEFRRVVGSVANVSEGGNNIASIVSSGEYYGNGIIAQLSSADSEGDMIMTLYNLIREEKALEQANTLEGMSESESISYVMAEIMQEANFPMVEDAGNVQALREALLLGAEKNKAVAAKVDAAIKSAINAKSRASSLWRNAAQVEAAGREALEYYRAIDEQRRLMEQEEIIRHLKSEAAQKLRDSTKIKDLSMKSAAKERHIQQVVKRLHKLRTGETDYKNIPEYLKGFVGEVVTLFGENYGAMVWSKEQADRVVSLYERLNSADGPYAEIAPFFDEDMMDTLKALREWAEKYEQLRYGKGVTRLERAQLRYLMDEAVADLVDHVNAIVRNSRNLFNAGRKQQFAQIGTAVKDELLEREDKTVLLGKPGTVAKWIDNAIRTGNITPVYFFEQLGNHELSALFSDFRHGQEEYAFTLDAVQDKIRNLKEQYDYNAWKDAEELAFQTSQGHNITLTKEQALWLYATWKREQANDIAATEHLTKGGFVYEGNADPNGKKGLLQKGRSNTTGHLISEKDMAVVDNYLTAEEKAYADAMVELLSKDMAALGNRVSMEMFGIRKYKEKYYFPYKTVGDQLNQTSLTGATNTTDDSRLKHSSHTHRLTTKARTALVMGNFSDVVANHVSQMVTYSSFVLPIENMNRVLNYRFETDDGSQSTIRSLIRQKYGENALKYIETFLHDMNGGIRSDTRSGVGALVSLHKKAAVVASLSVALQQPSSILRAAALMNPKYLLKGTVTKADYEELKEHSGVAIIKQMGRFDTNVGRSNVEWLLEDDYSKLPVWKKMQQSLNPKDWESFKYRWNVLATGLPTIMDEISWGKLWNAVKAEQADLHPDMDHSSDEFLDMCGERFNDIVDHTQVYDSLLAKSQLMRSKSDIDKMVTSFAAEPTLTLNMLYDAFANKNHPDRKKRIWSTVFSITASSLAAAIGSALISAWNKDDDKRTAQEKLLNKTVSAFIDNMNPLNNIPYIRDLYSLFQGYEVERADMSIFSDIVSAVQKVKSSNYTGYRKVEELAGSIANLFGVPVKNVMRDLRRIYNAATSDWTDPTQTGIETAWVDAVDEAFPFVDWYKTGVNDYYERDLNAMLKGDKAMVSDISRYLREVRGKEDKDIMSGVKSAAKDRVKNGSLDSQDAINALTKAYPDDVDADTLYWDYEKLKTGSTTKYEAFYTAIESGKDLKSEIQRYLDNGVSKETLAGMISKKYQTTLAELYKTNKTKAADLQAKLLAAYVLLGYDREKKLKDIKKWYE